MSDFSSVTISKDFPLLPKNAKRVSYFQTSDLPTDSSSGASIDGAVNETGLFLRSDSGRAKMNHDLNGWIELLAAYGPIRLLVNFKNGRVVEILEDSEQEVTPYSALKPASDSPNNWKDI